MCCTSVGSVHYDYTFEQLFSSCCYISFFLFFFLGGGGVGRGVHKRLCVSFVLHNNMYTRLLRMFSWTQTYSYSHEEKIVFCHYHQFAFI